MVIEFIMVSEFIMFVEFMFLFMCENIKSD